LALAFHAVSDLSRGGRRPGRPAGHGVDALTTNPSGWSSFFSCPRQFQKHLHTLSNIAKNLHNADFRNALATAPDAESIYRVIASMRTAK
jgi:hypothetical protein